MGLPLPTGHKSSSSLPPPQPSHHCFNSKLGSHRLSQAGGSQMGTGRMQGVSRISLAKCHQSRSQRCQHISQAASQDCCSVKTPSSLIHTLCGVLVSASLAEQDWVFVQLSLKSSGGLGATCMCGHMHQGLVAFTVSGFQKSRQD